MGKEIMDHAVEFCPHGKRETVILALAWFCIGHQAGNGGQRAFRQFQNLFYRIVLRSPGQSVAAAFSPLPLKNILYRLALRITCNNAEAEDIVQDTLMKVWNRRERWDEIDSIEAFCMTICRNLALDRMRKMDNHNSSLEDNLHETPSATRNPYEEMNQKDRIQLVRKLVDSLPEKQRTCMQLRDFEGKSYKEVAEILQISEDQVKVNIFRARQTIKQRFKELDDYGL